MTSIEIDDGDWLAIDAEDTETPKVEDIKALRDSRDKMHMEMDSLRQEMSALSERLNGRTKENDSLIDRNMQSEQLVRELTNKISELETEVARLRKAADSTTSELGEQESILADIEEALLKASSESDRYKVQNENLERENEHLKELVQTMRQDLEDGERRYMALADQKAAATAEATNHENHVSQMKTEVTRLQAVLARQEVALENALTDTDSVRSERDNLAAIIDEYRETLSAIAPLVNVPVVETTTASTVKNYRAELINGVNALKAEIETAVRERDNMGTILNDAMASSGAGSSNNSGAGSSSAGSAARAGEKKISFKAFEAGDLALFFPTTNGLYVAFNEGAPNYYMSEESMEAFGVSSNRRDYILCEIIEINDVVEDTAGNKYGVRAGTELHMVTGFPA